MTKEQIKQMAEKNADAYTTPDLEDSFRVYIYEANKDGYITGATEATKELQEEVNEWKTKFENLQKYLDTQNCYRECAETWKKNKELQEENEKYKEMIEDMKVDMCGTESETLCNYLIRLLKKYEFIY